MAARSENWKDENRRKSAATRLVDLALAAGCEFFLFDDEPIATYPHRGHRETARLRDQRFRMWLHSRFFDASKSAPNGQAFQNALSTMQGLAYERGSAYPVYVRIGPDHADGLFVDLGDSTWSAVHIDPEGWRVVAEPPVRFLRPSGLSALPRPEPGGNLEELREFWNVATDAQFRLAVVFILQALRPKGPYCGEQADGPQGSGKTLFAMTQRALVDPNSAPVRTTPRGELDLIVAAKGGQLLCFDNLSSLRRAESDALCRMATGAGLGKRTLYTDLAETIAWVERPFVLNGISPVATRSDLLDRLIRVSLEPISSERRMTPTEFWSKWDSKCPRLLGALYSAYSGALAATATPTRPRRLPRMADVALFGLAVEKALHWPAGAFLQALDANSRAADEDALESSPIPAVLVRAVSPPWSGTATELLKILDKSASDPEKRDPSWPKIPRTLSQALRELQPNLGRIGWELSFDDKARPKEIRIERKSCDGCVGGGTRDDWRTQEGEVGGASSEAGSEEFVAGVPVFSRSVEGGDPSCREDVEEPWEV